MHHLYVSYNLLYVIYILNYDEEILFIKNIRKTYVHLPQDRFSIYLICCTNLIESQVQLLRVHVDFVCLKYKHLRCPRQRY